MLKGHDVAGKIILEPSAGSGNIVDFLKKEYAKEVIACELNAKLRKIVESKCTVICDDFLKVQAEDISHIDMIVMNPPFSDARRHILHAYEIAPGGCEIVALCNSSDLRNSWNLTQDQKKIQELVENYGYEEDFHDCFSNAERKTNVYVSCVHLYKPKSGDFEFEDYMFSTVDEETYSKQENGLVEYNVVRDVVARYIEAVKRFDSVQKASKEINDLTSLFRTGWSGIVFGAHDIEKKSNNITRDYFKKTLQKQAWRYIINKLELGKFVTSKVREQINAFVEKQVNIPFTMKNIYQMIYMIIGTHDERMNNCLVEAFDNICSFSAENSTAGEKWKTNANYMVNKRFIVPCITDYDIYANKSPYLHLSAYSGQYDKIEDVILALIHLTGKKPADTIRNYINSNDLAWGEWHDCGTFFRFRGYKKGTMHFEFVDEKVWELFNRRVSELKGWQLGKSTKKKRA